MAKQKIQLHPSKKNTKDNKIISLFMIKKIIKRECEKLSAAT